MCGGGVIVWWGWVGGGLSGWGWVVGGLYIVYFIIFYIL
jgi:hypothetical protein